MQACADPGPAAAAMNPDDLSLFWMPAAELVEAWTDLLQAEQAFAAAVPLVRGRRLPARTRAITDEESLRFLAIEQPAQASAFLWRLELLGVDVGVKWELVADQWEAASPLDGFATDAWLAMMAFVGAGRELSQRQVLVTLKVTSLGWGREAWFAKAYGMGAAQAILAFGAGRYAEAVDLLRPLRENPPPFGWTRLHRDLLHHTLLESAIRAGQRETAARLASALRPAAE